MILWPGRWKAARVVEYSDQIGIRVVNEIDMARCRQSVQWIIVWGVGLRDEACVQLASCLVLLLMLMLMLLGVLQRYGRMWNASIGRHGCWWHLHLHEAQTRTIQFAGLM